MCDRGGRHRSHQLHVNAGGDQAGLERRLEHVVGDAGVLADDHQRLAPFAPASGQLLQDVAIGIAQAQDEIRRDRAFADPAADPIGAEVFAGHRRRPDRATRSEITP